jgi:hypothetical protein
LECGDLSPLLDPRNGATESGDKPLHSKVDREPWAYDELKLEP